MSKSDKLKARLYSRPKDFTWDELVKVLSNNGYVELKSGATSARKFVDERQHVINLHKPHPGNIVKSYAIEMVADTLRAKDIEKQANEAIQEGTNKKK